MAALTWDNIGERLYETGVRNVVLYPVTVSDGVSSYGTGVAWNGVTQYTESPSGAEPTALWADDIKYLNLISAEELGATVECYTYPDEFKECNGMKEMIPGVVIGQQNRKQFGLCARTTLGNDTQNNDYSYKLHLLYGCTAKPSEMSYSSINDSPEAQTLSFELSTTPINVAGYKPTASLTIDASKFTSSQMKDLTDVLYGSDGTNTYTASTDTAFKPGVIYYERTGTEGAYVYTPTTATAPVQGTTYYVNGARTPRLPLPSEVVQILQPSVTPGEG